jgi:hypothetical protein
MPEKESLTEGHGTRRSQKQLSNVNMFYTPAINKNVSVIASCVRSVCVCVCVCVSVCLLICL